MSHHFFSYGDIGNVPELSLFLSFPWPLDPSSYKRKVNELGSKPWPPSASSLQRINDEAGSRSGHVIDVETAVKEKRARTLSPSIS